MSKFQAVTSFGMLLLLVLCSCRQETSENPIASDANPILVPSGQKGGQISDPYAGATSIAKDGVIVLYLRGDEIVKDGAVVGSFDDAQVRKDGSIVGEIRTGVYRHEGSEVWKLDQGNLYPGTEIRLEGSIIGDIRADGTIWRDGSPWAAAEPYDASTEENMRIMVALYYFSDYFGSE